MPAEPKPAPTERGASDEAEREKMSIEIEDGEKAKVKKSEAGAATPVDAAAVVFDNEAEKEVSGAGQAAADETDAASSATEATADTDQVSEAEEAEVLEESGAGKEADADTEASADVDAEASAEANTETSSEATQPSNDELVAKAQAEAKDWQDKFMRLHAEWDTYRRRTAEQREQERARAAEKLVTSLLPVIDDFERTIDYAENNGESGLLDGVKAVHTKVVDVLKKEGVVVIDPAGDAFDALEHQAVATVEDDQVPDETVRDVYQKGYKLSEKVLRPAMVRVTTGGPKRLKEESSEEE